ncbi:hypothetical protein Tco_0475585 [Tanacetum coccineum]
MGAFAKHPHSVSNEVCLVTRKYRYTNGEAQSQIDLFTAFAFTPKRTSLDPLWSELELHLSGDEFLRCDLKEWIKGCRVRLDKGDKEVTRPNFVAKVVMEVLGFLLGDMVVRSWWCLRSLVASKWDKMKQKRVRLVFGLV